MNKAFIQATTIQLSFQNYSNFLIQSQRSLYQLQPTFILLLRK